MIQSGNPSIAPIHSLDTRQLHQHRTKMKLGRRKIDPKGELKLVVPESEL